MVEEANYTVFRDCLAEVINARSHTSEGTGPKRSRARGRKRTKSVAIKEVEKPTANQNIDTSDDLSEFVEVGQFSVVWITENNHFSSVYRCGNFSKFARGDSNAMLQGELG